MKMKYLVGVMIVIYIIFMSTVVLVGFLNKQELENKATKVEPSTTSTNNNNFIEQPSTINSAKTFTVAEVAVHNKPSDCWIIIENKVYDVARFLDLHPGGSDLIIPYCGKDATTAFNTQGGRRSSHSQRAINMLQQYLLGDLQ